MTGWEGAKGEAMRLQGKVAIVTGAGRGIGRAIACRFAGEGASVAIGEIDADVGQQAADQLAQSGASVRFYRTDVSEPDQIRSLARQTVQQFGGLDILINNAAIPAPTWKA